MASHELGNHPFRRPIIRYFLLWMIGLSILFLGLVYFAAGGFDQLNTNTAEIIVQLLSIIPIIWFIGGHMQKKLPLRCFFEKGVRTYSWFRLFGIWLLIFIFGYGADGMCKYGLSYLVPDYIETTLQISVISPEFTLGFNILLVFIVACITPVMEELVFRGLLLHRLAVKWGIYLSIIISSVCFGLLHGEGWIGSGMFGLCMCLIYLKTKNLWIPILIHIFNNLVAVMIIFVSNQIEEFQNLGTLRADIWFFVVALVVSIPLLYNFVKRSWPAEEPLLPCFQRQNQRA